SVIMSDIDHFKNVNTQFGHLGGDAALVELARVIRETVQEEGPEMMPGRYGGEEFCVLIPGEGPEQALGLAEKIRKRIEAEPIHIGDQVTHITISIGVSSWPTHTEHIQALDDFFRLADEALYICKDRGRNCSSLYDPEHKRPPAKNYDWHTSACIENLIPQRSNLCLIFIHLARKAVQRTKKPGRGPVNVDRGPSNSQS
ncbi:MAG TPA: GGDEF domain-containing protein, partial [Leptospiraceae bacterium]|nr:GGDEF domain-containing protein [Leptospiraceae bacterium]